MGADRAAGSLVIVALAVFLVVLAQLASPRSAPGLGGVVTVDDHDVVPPQVAQPRARTLPPAQGPPGYPTHVHSARVGTGSALVPRTSAPPGGSAPPAEEGHDPAPGEPHRAHPAFRPTHRAERGTNQRERRAHDD